MNEKAKELNLKNTHFVTPHGLDEEEHYTTAYELAIIADYALNIDKISEVVKTKIYNVNIDGNIKTITNTNELLGYLEGVNGVKTGFTNGAGRCLVTSVERNGFNIITVILGADTKKIRTKDSINLIEYVYKNYELINLEELISKEFSSWKNINVRRITINKGIENELRIKLGNLNYKLYPIKKVERDNIKITINALNYLEAPVISDTKIGEIKILVGEQEICNVDINAENNINKKNIWDYLEIMIKSLV